VVVGTIARKLRLVEGQRAHLVDVPPDVWRAIEAPPLELVDDLAGEFDHLHLFCTSRAAMDTRFPKLRPHLRPSGSLWVSWPKARQLGTDLTLPTVIEIGYRHGLVESTCLSIDATWSALRFTHPKPGKQYHNSYGTLPS
jgi:hypothetical protein